MRERPFIVVAELMWLEGLDILRECGEVMYDPDLWQFPGDLAARLACADALVVRNRTRVTGNLLDRAPALRGVGRLGAGLDNIDLAACRSRGVEVVYAPGVNAVSVAEMTMGLILALVRRIPAADNTVRRGRWERRLCTGTELMGKSLGIVGFGRIGRLVAARARVFGMEVLVHHPRLSPTDPDLTRMDGRLFGLEELLRAVDFLTLHLPLTTKTRCLIGARELALMKSTACLVNTGRGGVVDETALADALAGGALAGAALDVRDEEPPPTGHPLVERLNRLPNIILTPHVAGLTREAQIRTCTLVAGDVARILAGEPPLRPAPFTSPPPPPP